MTADARGTDRPGLAPLPQGGARHLFSATVARYNDKFDEAGSNQPLVLLIDVRDGMTDAALADHCWTAAKRFRSLGVPAGGRVLFRAYVTRYTRLDGPDGYTVRSVRHVSPVAEQP